MKLVFLETRTFRVTAEVFLGGLQAVSLLTPLTVRNPLSAGRTFILLQTERRHRCVKSDVLLSQTSVYTPAQSLFESGLQ